MNTFRTNWKTASIVLASFVAYAGQAEDNSAPWLNIATNNAPGGIQITPSSQKDIWVDEIGCGFKKGATEVGASAAYGLGLHAFGSNEAHDLALGAIHAGRMLSDVVAKDSWFRGNWEVLGEGVGGIQTHPNSASLGAVDGFLRYNFITGTPWVPFIEGGGGVIYTDIGKPDLGTPFEFNEKVGVGLHYFFTRHLAATLEVRFMHISNAGIKQPNDGVDDMLTAVGLNYFF
jgi:lipid A 3-O-deacylase